MTKLLASSFKPHCQPYTGGPISSAPPAPKAISSSICHSGRHRASSIRRTWPRKARSRPPCYGWSEAMEAQFRVGQVVVVHEERPEHAVAGEAGDRCAGAPFEVLLVDGRLVLVPTKTRRSRRTVPLGPVLTKTLKEHRGRQAAERMAAGSW
jgi:hypothetical protein